MDVKFIKDTVFDTVDFSYDKEIEFFEFDGVKVEYDGKTARIGAKEKAALARGCCGGRAPQTGDRYDPHGH